MNFLKKTFSPVLLTISLLLLINTIYMSEIYWAGNKRSFYGMYYLVSSLLIFFSIVTFFINRKIKEYLIISCISIVAGLYLVEGYLVFKEQLSKEQLSKEQLSKQRYEKKTGKKFDSRNWLELYESLKKKNNEVVMSVPGINYFQKNYSIFPLSGISNSETIHCNENGYFSLYESDRYGFNNPDTEWDKKEIEYLLVGDSFTHGACVNRPNDIASVLRALSNKSVLNLGQHGNGPLIEYASLREYLNLGVKKVLWIYYEENDLIDLEKETNHNLLINYLNNLNFTQNLKTKQNKINNLAINLIEQRIEEYKEILERKTQETFISKLIKFFKITKVRKLFLPKTKSQVGNFEIVLQLANELVNKNNSILYFVYLPEYSRYTMSYDDTNYNLVKKIVSKLNIPFIDINEEVFKKENNPLTLFPFELPFHYTSEAYKKIAKTIYELSKD